MKIGLIAGGGQFPVLFSRTARERGFSVYAAAFKKEADPDLARFVDEIEWLHLGQVKRLIRFFRKNGVREAVMLGTIRKVRMFTDVRPDLKAISLMARMRSTHDDGILRAFADLLQGEEIRVRASTFLLPELLAGQGCWTRKRPTRAQAADIALGWEIAKEIGRLDIGQTVVVGGGTVLAVEAIDGTDSTIRRGGGLGRGSVVVVKVCKPNQDTRFDIPAIGAETVRTMHESGADLLAVEAGKAVVFDREEMVSRADEWGICIVGLREGAEARELVEG